MAEIIINKIRRLTTVQRHAYQALSVATRRYFATQHPMGESLWPKNWTFDDICKFLDARHSSATNALRHAVSIYAFHLKCAGRSVDDIVSYIEFRASNQGFETPRCIRFLGIVRISRMAEYYNPFQPEYIRER